MQSRKDQVQAYFYVVGRLTSAVMHGRPDAYEPPNRRPVLGYVIGLLLALVIAGGFGIYGLFRPGGDSSWREPGVLIVVKETGARYLMVGGQLRPVLNYASARLVIGESAQFRVVSVSRSSLTQVTVGTPIGIPDAPDSLPAADKLYTGAWTLCAQPETAPASVLFLHEPPSLQPVADAEGFLVRAGQETYLVAQGRRYRLAAPEVTVALGYAAVEPIKVSAAWLNPIPAGRDLAFPQVDGRGQPGPELGGRGSVVGQVFEVRNQATGDVTLYLARGDGLVRLSRTVATLALADARIRTVYPDGAVAPLPLRADELAGTEVAASTEFVDPYPADPPRLGRPGPDDLPCVRYRPVDGTTGVTLMRTTRSAATGAVAVPRLTTAGTTVDRTVIPAGTGVLVRNRYAPGAVGALFLVCEYGLKYPLPGEAVSALGYGGVAPVDLPGELLSLVPSGPALDPETALTTRDGSR
ncbi:type VII secretion protein EccB [Catenuloplanes atrovinosus]|uniref:Type VII secretion protein EccB n=1 Tax=Catenuloplanes atrovinosus TaxID=137266 RepID=A0AAE3YQA3_9ACTN|nr:type VII secretion protein EccB [Catenuloplanes atrovinosus]MDR7277297.1 type VII secretion protein EccB [Catenuloplanes atrovinosus]